MKDKMTQREWDRIVGIGNPPDEKKEKLKFTNHQPTYDRHPDNQVDDKEE